MTAAEVAAAEAVASGAPAAPAAPSVPAAPAAPATFSLIPLGDANAVVCDGDSCVIPAAD